MGDLMNRDYWFHPRADLTMEVHQFYYDRLPEGHYGNCAVDVEGIATRFHVRSDIIANHTNIHIPRGRNFTLFAIDFNTDIIVAGNIMAILHGTGLADWPYTLLNNQIDAFMKFVRIHRVSLSYLSATSWLPHWVDEGLHQRWGIWEGNVGPWNTVEGAMTQQCVQVARMAWDLNDSKAFFKISKWLVYNTADPFPLGMVFPSNPSFVGAKFNDIMKGVVDWLKRKTSEVLTPLLKASAGCSDEHCTMLCRSKLIQIGLFRLDQIGNRDISLSMVIDGLQAMISFFNPELDDFEPWGRSLITGRPDCTDCEDTAVDRCMKLVHELRVLIGVIKDQFEGLCADCMDRSASNHFSVRKMYYRSYSETYHKNCPCRHDYNTWFFSFCGDENERAALCDGEIGSGFLGSEDQSDQEDSDGVSSEDASEDVSEGDSDDEEPSKEYADNEKLGQLADNEVLDEYFDKNLDDDLDEDLYEELIEEPIDDYLHRGPAQFFGKEPLKGPNKRLAEDDINERPLKRRRI